MSTKSALFGLLSHGVFALLLSPAPTLAAVPADPLPSLHPMLQKVMPGVVNISVRGTVKADQNPLAGDPRFGPFADPFFRRFFGLPENMPDREVQEIGSGVIIDAREGLVVTNHHVVEHASDIVIVLPDGRRVEAKMVGSDPETDVALLDAEASLPGAVPLGNSAELRIGDFVVAIGNPFGIGQTATLGIVSATGRRGLGLGYENFIQTDASINPGNSGGALVTQHGELVGINTAILSGGTGGNLGIGFAIPVNMVRHVVEEIRKYGEVRRGQLGVIIQDLTPDLAEAMGLGIRNGAVVTRVTSGSPAEKAGIRVGDVITSVNNAAVSDSAELRNRIGAMDPEDEITLRVLRDGNSTIVKTRLGEREEATAKQAKEPEAPGSKLSGVRLGSIPEGHPLHGRVDGVFVVSVAPDSAAAQAGLRPGDVIVQVNRNEVDEASELRELAQRTASVPLLLLVRREEGALFIAIS